MAMGEQLDEDMSRKWQQEAFTDSFREQILQLVKDKVEAGEVEAVGEPEALEAEPRGAKILDLTEMLRRSLDKGAASGKAPAKSRPAKRASGPQAGDRPTSGKAAGKDAGGAAGKTGRKTAPSRGSTAAKAAGGKIARAKATKKPAGSGRKAA
jgi:DNA end-binding protein Ku